MWCQQQQQWTPSTAQPHEHLTVFTDISPTTDMPQFRESISFVMILKGPTVKKPLEPLAYLSSCISSSLLDLGHKVPPASFMSQPSHPQHNVENVVPLNPYDLPQPPRRSLLIVYIFFELHAFSEEVGMRSAPHGKNSRWIFPLSIS